MDSSRKNFAIIAQSIEFKSLIRPLLVLKYAARKQCVSHCNRSSPFHKTIRIETLIPSVLLRWVSDGDGRNARIFHRGLMAPWESNTYFTIPDKFEYLRLLAFPLLHAILHGGNDAVGFIFGAVLRALLGSSCNRERWGG